MHRLERVLARLATTEAPEALMRRRAELVLAQVAHIAVAVLIANDRACYVDANAAAERLTGYPRSELLRMAIWDPTPGSPGPRPPALARLPASRAHAQPLSDPP
jgi:PAS domain-containing protein